MLDDRDAIMRVLRGRDIRAIFGLFHACAVSDQRGLDYSSDWRVSTWGGKGRESVRLPLAEVGPLLARAEPDVAAAAHAWLAHEGGPAAKAWLASRGRLTAAPAAETHAFSIAGVTPGMKRADVQRLAAKAVGVKYDEHGSAVVVSGNSLRDGAREIVSSATRAGDVRDLFGRPDREHSDHVFATMGGFFWQYERSGVVIVFSFTDDRFTLNEKAPLFQVKLLDPAAHRAMPKP
jgi:hypothetical protein